MIIAASDNGGRYNKVHRQTSDNTGSGHVISVVSGDSLLPLVFTYKDYLGDEVSSLISNGYYPHSKLMRGDCGWREEDDSVDLSFSWNTLERVSEGFSDAPSGEFVENYKEVPNVANDVLLCGLEGHRTKFYRKDREYWTPNQTLAGDNYDDIFGPTQWNPQACEPRKPNKCGLVNYKEEEC